MAQTATTQTFMSEDQLRGIAEGLLERAKRAGADQADVTAATGESLGVSARGGALEDVERSESVDFGLRVMIEADGGVRVASISASDPADSALDALAERVVAMAKEAPVDPYAGLAPEDALDRSDIAARIASLELVDPAGPPNPDQLLDEAIALEKSALAVSGVAQVEGADSSWSGGVVYFATSHGFAAGYRASSRSLSVSAVAGEGLGMERDYDFSAARFAEDLKSVEEIGAEAGRKAVRRLNPQKATTGAFPVIYEPRVATRLVSAVLGGANGAAVARGSSFLRDKMGEAILPESFSIYDDPLKVRGLGSRPFDGEGLPVSKKAIVENGKLANWLLDWESARKLGVASNGSAGRGVAGGPSPSSTNVWITPGEMSAEALIKETGEGLLVTEMMGRGVNAVTGDYSTGASGFWIRGGEIAEPVSELTIAGNIFQMLSSLTAANDLTFDRRIVAPTLRVEGLTIASG